MNWTRLLPASIAALLFVGQLTIAPAPVFAAAPLNDDFSNPIELTIGTGLDISPATFKEATAEFAGDIPACDYDDDSGNPDAITQEWLFNWDPDALLADGACGDGETGGDQPTSDHSATYYFDAASGSAYQVLLVVPTCIAAVNNHSWRIQVFQGPDAGNSWLFFAEADDANEAYAYESATVGAGETYSVPFSVPYESEIRISLSAEYADFDALAAACPGETVTLSVDDLTDAAPENDLFTNATVLEPGESIDVDTSYATTSWDDQNLSQEYDYTTKTTWYQWTATTTDTYTFNTLGSSCIFRSEIEYDECADTVMSVYTYDDEMFVQLDENDDCDDYDDDNDTLIYEEYLSCISLEATSGTTYYFQVGLYNYESADALIHVEFESELPLLVASPRIDNARPRLGRRVLATVDNGVWSATSEIEYAYQWFACTRRLNADAPEGVRSRRCKEVAGATEAEFTLQRGRIDRALRGRFLLAEVTASTDAGSVSAYTRTSNRRITGR